MCTFLCNIGKKLCLSGYFSVQFPASYLHCLHGDNIFVWWGVCLVYGLTRQNPNKTFKLKY